MSEPLSTDEMHELFGPDPRERPYLDPDDSRVAPKDRYDS